MNCRHMYSDVEKASRAKKFHLLLERTGNSVLQQQAPEKLLYCYASFGWLLFACVSVWVLFVCFHLAIETISID